MINNLAEWHEKSSGGNFKLRTFKLGYRCFKVYDEGIAYNARLVIVANQLQLRLTLEESFCDAANEPTKKMAKASKNNKRNIFCQ